MLTGEELVAKGVTKIDATLPEIGTKDISPNGSWLEEKQIQSALEARKHLVEVERIEKCGSLSHAEWRDDLKLAEVTKQAGNYWQYLGCHMDKKLYLKPEEALFLIEVNSLLLKHNEVTVSIQKAYSLLLNDIISINQYKVYASLSRLGYKVYRYNALVRDEIKNKTNVPLSYHSDVLNINEGISRVEDMNVDSQNTSEDDKLISECSSKGKNGENTKNNEDGNGIAEIVADKQDAMAVDVEDNKIENSKNNSFDIDTVNRTEDKLELLVHSNMSSQKYKDDPDNEALSQDYEITDVTKENNNVNPKVTISQSNSRKSLTPKLKPGDSENLHNYFSAIPEMYKKNEVTINAPNADHIPKNIFVNKMSYILNLERIRMKNVNTTSQEPNNSVSGMENETLRRIRNSTRNDSPQFCVRQQLFSQVRAPYVNQHVQHFNFWRPRGPSNYFQFNMFCQRPFFHSHFMPRFNFHYRTNNFLRRLPNQLSNPGHFTPNFLDIGLGHKRKRDERKHHLENIKNIASIFKQLILMGNTNTFNAQSLQRKILNFNNTFRSRLRLTDDFEIVDDTNILETIEIEDEDESKKKKSKQENDTFKENLDNLRNLALRLKNMEDKEIISSKARKALFNAIEMFNESFKTNVYFNNNYEIIEQRPIIRTTTSDSDCVNENKGSNSKMLRNPFSVLKTLTKTVNKDQPSTSNSSVAEVQNSDLFIVDKKNGGEDVSLIGFDKNWLPNSNDFGKPEVVSKKSMSARVMDTYNNEMLYHFIHNNTEKYGNWLTAKIDFSKFIEATNMDFQIPIGQIGIGGLQPLIRPGDSTDMQSVLNKIRIIKTDKEVRLQNKLRIHFDVYNRDVQNFRKSNRPKPHFRIICIEEYADFPSGEEIIALHTENKDGVPIVFAVTGIGSISYLQVNPIDIPLNIPSNEMT